MKVTPIASHIEFGRQLAKVMAFAVALAMAYAPNLAAGEPSHGLSAFGKLKYPTDFTHFDYVNPEAPKGGRLSMIGTAGLVTFDSFNNFMVKGDRAQGLEYVYDSPYDAGARRT